MAQLRAKAVVDDDLVVGLVSIGEPILVEASHGRRTYSSVVVKAHFRMRKNHLIHYLSPKRGKPLELMKLRELHLRDGLAGHKIRCFIN